MSQETVSADVTAEVTDEQFNKFFETGGAEAPSAEFNKEVTTASEADKTQTEQKESQKLENTEDQSKEKVEKVVSYGALHEERERRKELQRQVQELKSQTQQMEQGFQKFISRVQQPNEQPPSYDENPLEALRYEQRNIQNLILQHNEYLNQKHEVERRNALQNQFVNKYQQSAAEYARENPEFGNAYAYLLQSRGREYLAAGYTNEQAKQLMIEDELAIASKAYQDGVNPAERIYKLAESRGYSKLTNNTANTAYNQNTSNQAEEKLKQVEKGIQASKSINSAQGKTSNEMSLAALAQLSDEELEEYVSSNWNKVAKMMR